MKNTIIQALSTFVRQRPGLEFGNYGDAPAYRAELRRITQPRHDAERLPGNMTIHSLLTTT